MRTKKGIVTSAKMQGTCVVTVHSYKNHPKYKKRYRISKKFFVHDPENVCQEGDEVIIRETLPLSKKKRWELAQEESAPDSVQKKSPQVEEL